MTFLEAAIEVLKREGKPLEVRPLAELAVRHNLLSVVGRDPVGTMQQRLDDALEKPDAKMPLYEVSRGTYGLRSYPPRPYPAARAPSEEKKTNGHPRVEPSAATAEAEDQADGEEVAGGEAAATGEAAAGGDKKKRRRGRRGGRGRRGRHEGGEATAAATGSETSDAAEAPEDEAAGDASAAPAEEAGAPSEAAAEEKRSQRRSRRGGRGRRGSDRQEAELIAGGDAPSPAPTNDVEDQTPTGEHRVVRVEEPSIEADEPAAATTFEERALLDEPADAQAGLAAAPEATDDLLSEEAELLDEELGGEDFDLPGGPLLAPSHGAEEVTRSEDERVVREEIMGRRSDERSRRRGPDGGRGRGRGREKEPRRDGPEAPRGQGPQRHEEKRPERHEAKRAEPPREHAQQAKRAETGNLIEVILDVLKTSDGRPMHVRQMAEVAIKRNLAGGLGGHGDVVRQLRAAMVREQRDREADGLRARVRALGGGHFAAADRKLDAELVPLERDLAHMAQKLRDATRSALRRRIQRLPPPAFEALCRALLDKLGISGVELVRRGEGVAYYGGQRAAGVSTVKTLVAMRPGEQELGRRAVGELRAGLAAKGFDEGLLIAAGRLNGEALAEVKNGAGVSAHDAESLAALCLRHGLGVRRVQMPIDYLDLELFSELTEV